MGPIPVAIVLTSFDAGGTERQMIELMCRLDPARFRVHAVCLRRTGAWLARAESAACEVAEFPLRSFKSPTTLRPFRALVSWLRERGILVAHTSDLYANVFGLPAAAAARVPVRIGNRRELRTADKTRVHWVAQRLAYRAAHRVVANCGAAAAQLRLEGVPASDIRVIPNGIDLSRFPRGKRHHAGRTLVTVANLRAEKAHDVLLRAMPAVLARVPGTRLRIVGEGPLRASLTSLAEQLGVSSSVEFLSHREDVPALLAGSTLFVLPSLMEAFPNGVIEAMAAKLPVVASAVGGICELVQDGRNGRLVPPGDVAALASAIADLLEQPEAADRLARAGRQTIESGYSFERMVAAFEDLYSSELAARRPQVVGARELMVS